MPTHRSSTRTAIYIAVAATFLALSSDSARADIYKWVDEKGVVNYGAEPPAGRKVQKLDTRAPAVSIVATDPGDAGTLLRDQSLRQRVARLEQELDDERRTRAIASQSESNAERARLGQLREACDRERRVDCDLDPYRTRYDSVIVFGPVVRPPRNPIYQPIFPKAGPGHFPPDVVAPQPVARDSRKREGSVTDDWRTTSIRGSSLARERRVPH